jgi:hypothetical protein
MTCFVCRGHHAVFSAAIVAVICDRAKEKNVGGGTSSLSIVDFGAKKILKNSIITKINTWNL